jgi:hypothetical protein
MIFQHRFSVTLLILIASALLLTAAENVSVHGSPNPSSTILHRKDSQGEKSESAGQRQPPAESAAPVQAEGASQSEKPETAHQTTSAITVVTPTDTALSWFTCLLVAVGFIQAWILRGTLIVSRAAERAYILAKCENGAGIGVGDKPRAVIVLKNFGRTPAYRLRYQMQISFAEYPMREDFKLPKLKGPLSVKMTITPEVEYGHPVISSSPLTRINCVNAKIEVSVSANRRVMKPAGRRRVGPTGRTG